MRHFAFRARTLQTLRISADKALSSITRDMRQDGTVAKVKARTFYEKPTLRDHRLIFEGKQMAYNRSMRDKISLVQRMRLQRMAMTLVAQEPQT